MGSKDVKSQDKLSVEECRKFFKKNKKSYTDAEVERIRNFFEVLADVIYLNYIKNK
jgi:hypothetical protein